MRYLYLPMLALLLVSVLLDLIAWGALPELGATGQRIHAAAHRENTIAVAYIAAGTPLTEAVPALRRAGARWLRSACAEGFARIDEAPRAAMDIMLGPAYNRAHGRLKLMYYAPPWLLLATLAAWTLRPRQIRLVGAR